MRSLRVQVRAISVVVLLAVISLLCPSPLLAAAPQAGSQKYKDSGEHELYSAVAAATDPKAQVELLNQWETKYPETDFKRERALYFVHALEPLAGDPAMRVQLIRRCQEMAKIDPSYYLAHYLIATWAWRTAGTPPSPEILATIQAAGENTVKLAPATFDIAKKKPTVSDAQWATLRAQAEGTGHNALAWVAVAKKDIATADKEYKLSLTANPNQGTIPFDYAAVLMDEKNYADALFYFARTLEYQGAGKVDAGTREGIVGLFNDTYVSYHGSMEGSEKVMEAARAGAVPPPGFHISPKQ